ncbi:MAG: hypothetical protein OXC41_01890 [Gammaproteobacteria bacterium]|nr:hypothetical protein [Gammaproteobacteria bacterium]
MGRLSDEIAKLRAEKSKQNSAQPQKTAPDKSDEALTVTKKPTTNQTSGIPVKKLAGLLKTTPGEDLLSYEEITQPRSDEPRIKRVRQKEADSAARSSNSNLLEEQVNREQALTHAKDFVGDLQDDSASKAIGTVEGAASSPAMAKPFCPRIRASLPRLGKFSENDVQMSEFPEDVRPPCSTQFELPGFESKITQCPSWLLWLFHRAGGQSMRQGHGAPWDMRIWIGVLLHLHVNDRDGDWYALQFPTNYLVSWIHPDGWSHKCRDWHRLLEALCSIRDNLAYVTIPQIGQVAIMVPTVIVEKPTDPIIEFFVRLPASTAHGDKIIWKTLCKYGTQSAILYRTYLSVCAHLGRSARHGVPLTKDIARPIFTTDGKYKRRKNGQIIRSSDPGDTIPNPSAKYSGLLTDADLAYMIGFDGKNRKHRYLARCALTQLAEDSVIEIENVGSKMRIFGPSLSNQ